MKKESFEEFKAKLQKKYAPLIERKVKKGNKSAIEFRSWGKRADGSTGEIIVGIYYTNPVNRLK